MFNSNVDLPYVVDGSLKLQCQGCLARVLDLLSEVERNAMALLLVGNVLCLAGALAGLELGAVELELVRIENQVVEAILFVDVGRDCNSALVGEAASELDVVNGHMVVRGFGPGVVSAEECS